MWNRLCHHDGCWCPGANRHQEISNRHADLIVTTVWHEPCNMYIRTTIKQTTTRTTRTPAFWGYPPPPHDYPSLSHIGSQIKRRQSKNYKFKEFVKITNLWILKRTLHATHLLKLLEKMCTYEMDPTSFVEDTEQTQFCPQTDRWMDRRTDGRTRWNQYTPFQLRWSGGYKNLWFMRWSFHEILTKLFSFEPLQTLQ